MYSAIERDLTPIEIHTEMKRLNKLLGPINARVGIFIVDWGAPYVSVSTGYDSMLGSIDVEPADTFSGMIANAERAIRNWHATRHDATIRKMALAVIDLTDEHTHCTMTLLRGKGFTEVDISEYSAKACERASEMRGKAPFVVEAK